MKHYRVKQPLSTPKNLKFLILKIAFLQFTEKLKNLFWVKSSLCTTLANPCLFTQKAVYIFHVPTAEKVHICEAFLLYLSVSIQPNKLFNQLPPVLI